MIKQLYISSAQALLVRLGKRSIMILSLLIITLNIYGAPFSNRTFFIYDVRGGAGDYSEFIKVLSQEHLGVAITLTSIEGSDLLYIPIGDSLMSVSDFADLIRDVVYRDKELIVPIFIDPAVSSGAISRAFKQSRIDELAYVHALGESWPSDNDILDRGKHIVLFSFDRLSSSVNNVHYAWDYISDLPYSGEAAPTFSGIYAHGSLSNELLMLGDFITPNVKGGSLEKLVVDINTNRTFINYPVDAWQVTGKQPNFIFTSTSPLYMSTIHGGIMARQPVQGSVKSNGVPLKKVLWVGDKMSITSGTFSFPYSDQESLKLEPYSCGYSIDGLISIDKKEGLVPFQSISASQIPITDGITALFSFEDEFINVVNKEEEAILIKSSVVDVVDRGSVLKIDSVGFVDISTAEDYGLFNSSFTVSTWLKISSYNENDNFSILGSYSSGFRKGLHLVIRDRHPYFGFWGNDLSVNYNIAAGRWHHIVFRYDVESGEQAVFVNGVLRGGTIGHPSFIGDSKLAIGKSLGGSGTNQQVGYLDDLTIWNRAIGDSDIYLLYKDGVGVETITASGKLKIKEFVYPLLLSLLLLLLIIISLMFARYRYNIKRSSIVDFDRTFASKIDDAPIFNQIYVLGRFGIYDSKGEDLSLLLSNKLQQLFLVMHLYSAMNRGKGVPVALLTDELWPRISVRKATNSRNVAINKLRKILSLHDVGSIVNRRERLYLTLNDNFKSDIVQLYSIKDNLEVDLTIEKVKVLVDLVERGRLLPEIECDWLLDIREEVSSLLVTLLTSCSKLLQEELQIQYCTLAEKVVARLVLEDDLNERALSLQIQVLLLKGKTSHAKYHFSKYCVKYNKVYNEPFLLEWSSFVDKI